MKHVIIGDIHGHDSWKTVVADNPDADKYIFLGDYVDSFSKSSEECARVLNEILEFKKSDPDKVVLILGNHDFHYLNYENRYSGWKYATYQATHDVYLNNIELFEILHEEPEALYSHAGLTEDWIHYFLNDGDPREIFGPVTPEVYEKLTGTSRGMSYEYGGPLGYLQFNYITGMSPYGDQTSSSPIWVRPASLLGNYWKGHPVQVVGHTISKKCISTHQKDPEDFTLWLCDTMHVGEYLVYDGEFKIQKFNIDG